jgi:hypothetical protein
MSPIMAAQDNVQPASEANQDSDRTGQTHDRYGAPSDISSRLSSLDHDHDYVDDEREIRTSTERRQRDYETLTGEEEAERLLLAGDEATSSRRSKNKSSNQRKQGLLSRRPRRSNGTDDEGELLFKAEKGGRSSSEDSSDPDSSRSNANPLKKISVRGKVSMLEEDQPIFCNVLTTWFSQKGDVAAQSP